MTTTPFRQLGDAGRMKAPPALLTVEETATYLRVCSKTIRKLVKTGALQHSRVGTQIRISEDAVNQYLRVLPIVPERGDRQVHVVPPVPR